MKLQRNNGDLYVLSQIPNEKGSHLKIFPNEKAHDISFDETFCKEHYLTNDGQSRKHVIVIKISKKQFPEELNGPKINHLISKSNFF